jgi:hypothetical protein
MGCADAFRFETYAVILIAFILHSTDLILAETSWNSFPRPAFMTLFWSGVAVLISHIFLVFCLGPLSPLQSYHLIRKFASIIFEMAAAFDSPYPNAVLLYVLSYTTFYVHQLWRTPSCIIPFFDFLIYCLILRYFFFDLVYFHQLSTWPDVYVLISLQLDIFLDALHGRFPLCFLQSLFSFLTIPLELVLSRELIADVPKSWLCWVGCGAGLFQALYSARRCLEYFRVLVWDEFPPAKEEDLARDGECAECGKSIQDGVMLPCGHPMHKSCTRSAIVRTGKCPQCLASVRKVPECEGGSIDDRPFKIEELWE